MKTLNKSLLAAAVIGVLAVPGLASAASLNYAGNKQITYARDLVVNSDTTIQTQDEFRLRATTVDASRIVTVKAGEVVAVKVTLTNGARFDASSSPVVLVEGFKEGQQTRQGVVATDHGGASATTEINYVPGTANYSGNGQELNFVYIVTKDAEVTTDVDNYFLEINSAQVRNLVQSLGVVGGSFDAEITVQNKDGQQVLSARQTVARSVWGIDVRSIDPFPNVQKRIDVGSPGLRKSLFAWTGGVGQSETDDARRLYFNAGGFELDIAKAARTNNGSAEYVNNYNAVASNPQFNIVGTAGITVTVTGLDLSAFIGRAWLDGAETCDTAASATAKRAALTITANAAESASAVISANHPLFKEVSDPSPNPSRVYVCLGAAAGQDGREMVPQPLSGTVSVDHGLPTQRVNPPALPFALQALELNGTTLTFQNVNPAGNSTAESFLRLTNNNARPCDVVIDAKDDRGFHSRNDVRLTIAAHASEQVNINVLESGNDPRFTNNNAGFGDGSGKWYVRVTAECVSFVGSALNRNSTTGVVTDLTAEKFIPVLWLTPDERIQ